MHFWSKFGDSNLNARKVIVRTSSKWGKIRLSSLIWPWRSRSITPKNNRQLNQGVLRLSSKFGDSSVNDWWVIVRTSKWLIHTHTDTRTDTQTQAMTIPEGQNWPLVKIQSRKCIWNIFCKMAAILFTPQCVAESWCHVAWSDRLTDGPSIFNVLWWSPAERHFLSSQEVISKTQWVLMADIIYTNNWTFRHVLDWVKKGLNPINTF